MADHVTLKLDLETGDGLVITGHINITDTEAAAEIVAEEIVQFFRDLMDENTPPDITVEEELDINEQLRMNLQKAG